MNKKQIFEKELNYIKDIDIREFTETVLESLPDYFYTVPASSTGKYHPNYALGEGGLVRHTKAAVGIAVSLFPLYDFFGLDRDCILSALILHDGLKHGHDYGTYTVHDHPVIMADYILKEFTYIHRSEIAELIETHMGQWTVNKYCPVVLLVPKSETQKFVHLCDYLASRKCLEFNFEVE